MRKRIVIAFLAVSLLACQNAFISMAEEAGSEDGSTASVVSAEVPVTEDTVEDNQETAEDEAVTESVPQAEQIEKAESDVSVMEEGAEAAVAPEAVEAEESQAAAPQEEAVVEEGTENAPAAYAEPAAIVTPEHGTYIDDNGVAMSWSLAIDGTLTYSGNGDVYGYIGSVGEVVKVVVEDGAKYVGGFESSYGGYPNLQEVSLPGSVTEIGMNAFYDCKNLKRVELSKGITRIGENAFLGCDSLTEIVLPESVAEIGSGAFYACYSLAEIMIPGSVTEIGGTAFGDCRNLKRVGLSKGITRIGVTAFADCDSLTEIVIPESVTVIDSNAFYGCRNLRRAELSKGITRIGEYVFGECSSLTEIVIPESVTVIDSNAFSGCRSLTEITIPANVRRMNGRSFSDCDGLSRVVFQGSAPATGYVEPFYGVTATAYYPAGDPTWTEEARWAIGSDLNWVAVGGLAEMGSPANVKASANTYNSLKITWNKVPGAQYYQVYRATSKNGSYARIGTYTGDTTSAISKSLSCGKTYYYKVRAYVMENGKAVYSGYSNIASGKTALAAPKGVKASANTYNTLKINWNKVDGANYYQVYRSSSPNGKYALLGTYGSNTTSAISRSLGCGTTYYYKIRAYRWVDGKRVFSGYSSVASGKPVLPAPGNVKAKRASSSTVQISWGSVSGGQYYQVYRATSKNGSYALLGTYDSKKTSSISKSLKKGTIYYYKVRTYRWVNGQRVFSPFSTVVSAMP